MKLPRTTSPRAHCPTSPLPSSWMLDPPRSQIVPAAAVVNPCVPNPCPQTAAQLNAGQTACCPMVIGGAAFPICYNPALNVCVGGIVQPIPPPPPVPAGPAAAAAA